MTGQREYLADQIYYSTVQIVGDNGTGTGFIYGHVFGNNLGKIFLVTNRHVITKNTKGSIKFHSSKTFYPMELEVGKCVTADFNETQWTALWKFHPIDDVDIAIFDLTELLQPLASRNQFIYYKALNSDQLITEENYPDISSIEQVVFVGYPKGFIDSQSLLPIARHGYTASPLKNNFDGKKVFLIDAAVFPGSSGSPVCILNEGVPYVDRHSQLHFEGRFIFLGVLKETGVDKDSLDPDLVKHYLNIGFVEKGIRVNEAIEHHILGKTITD